MIWMAMDGDRVEADVSNMRWKEERMSQSHLLRRFLPEVR